MNDEGTKTILAIGEVLWDLLPDGARLGGALFNLAARVGRLGDRALMVSRLGRDALGDEALAVVRSLGLDTTLLQRDDVYPTGTVQVCFDKKGIPDYFIVPGVAYDHVQTEAALDHAVSQADCFCFGTLVQRTAGTRETLRHLLAQAENCLKVLDINLRKDCYSRETVEYSLGHADLLKLNDDEVQMLDELLAIHAGDPVAFCTEIMARYPLEHCLVTFGENGALALSRGGETIYEPGYRVHVVDTLGSGDAFTAGFVHRFLHGATVRQACRFGNALGAMVATQVGGTEPIAPEAIARFENDGTERNVLPELERFMVD
ncbi:MAG: carbohydrate kinase [Phycisphaerales bacterium]|nr:MAG: carbohydrate kinase [Phycisphaerales bacterium]